MYKIGILFENREFEHDVYELIKAFYPEAEIHTLYEDDEARQFRKSHENPVIQAVYEEYLGTPNSHKAHQLLHTTYHKKDVYSSQ